MSEPKEWWDAYLSALSSLSAAKVEVGYGRDRYFIKINHAEAAEDAEKIADAAMAILRRRAADRRQLRCPYFSERLRYMIEAVRREWSSPDRDTAVFGGPVV